MAARPRLGIGAATTLLLGLAATGGVFALPGLLGSGSVSGTLATAAFVAVTIAAGFLTARVVSGFAYLAAGICILPAVAAFADPRSDVTTPIGNALLFVLLAGPGYVGGVIASGIAGLRDRSNR